MVIQKIRNTLKVASEEGKGRTKESRNHVANITVRDDFFPDANTERSKVVDLGKTREVVQDPPTPSDLKGKSVSDSGIDPETLRKCLDFCRQQVPDAEAELAAKSGLEVGDAAMSWVYKGVILLRSMRDKMENQASDFAIKEEKYESQISSLLVEVVKKEKERGEAVDAYHKLQSDLHIRLEKKSEELEALKKTHASLEKEFNYVQRKMAEKDQTFFDKCNIIWNLCNEAYDKVAAKPEAPCWVLGKFDPFFSWLCRQYEDLPKVVSDCTDLTCMYSSRALLHLLREAKDPLYDQMMNKDYHFPEPATLFNVATTTQQLCKKFFDEFWKSGGKERCFQKARERMQRQYEERLRKAEDKQRKQEEETQKRCHDGEVGRQ